MTSISLLLKRFAPIVSFLKYAGWIGLVIFALVLWRNSGAEAKLRAEAEAKNAVLEKKNADLDAQIKADQADASQAHAQGDADRAEIAKWKSQPPTIKTVNNYIPVEGPTKVIESCTNAQGQIEQVCDQGTVTEALQKEQNANAGRATCEANLKECMRKIADAAKVEEAQAFEIANLRAEKHNLDDALKGGTRWTRTKKELKCAGISGALAAGGAYYKKGLGAFIGAAGGELVCHVVGK